MAQAQTTHATTEAHGGAHEDVGFPPLETETFAGQLVWLAITFGLLYVLLSRMVLPRLGGILENRRSLIATDLDDAAAMKKRAEDAGAAYDKALAEARSRAQILAQETRSKLAAESMPSARSSKPISASAWRKPKSTIAAKKAQAMGNVRTIATDTAAAIVERLTGKAPSTQTIEAALDNVKP